MTTDSHYDAVLADYQASRRLPTLVASVLDDGAVCWTGGAGAGADVAAQFRIGSVTKTMTAVLVLQAREEGLLGLDDPMAAYLPEAEHGELTLRQLLSHTAGMHSEPAGPWWERSPGVDPATLHARNAGTGVVFEPGSTYHYSNLGYALLGEVVARVRGASWLEVLTARVLDPLGLTRTTYLPQEPFAHGLSVDHLRGTLRSEPHQDTGAMAPAGQLWSTLADLAAFARFLRDGHPQVLPVDTLREMQRPVLEEYGLGMFVHPWRGGTLVGHLGSMPGFQAVTSIDPDSGRGVVALTNGTTGFDGNELAERLLGEHTPEPATPWTPTERVPGWAEPLLGSWHWGNSAFELRWNNDLLEFVDLARGRVGDRFTRVDGRIVGVSGYHHGETLHVHPTHLECATFVYTRVPYDPAAPIPGE